MHNFYFPAAKLLPEQVDQTKLKCVILGDEESNDLEWRWTKAVYV